MFCPYRAIIRRHHARVKQRLEVTMIKVAARDHILRPWLLFAFSPCLHDAPPIPLSLLSLQMPLSEGYALDIPLECGYDIDWQESFSRNPIWIPWLDKWLRGFSVHSGDEIEEALKDVTSEELASRVAGWNAREIIDTFDARWRTCDPENPDSMIAATHQAIKRMETLTRDLLNNFSEWNSKGFGFKALLLQNFLRPWRYHELCLLQAELKTRYTLTRFEAVGLYRSCAHTWQTCWRYQKIKDYAFRLQYPVTSSPSVSGDERDYDTSDTEDFDDV